ncbi:hypothetical protein GT354_42915, partial [Streptomyces sp. SID3343]|nr:hypothetical protein [Streptomyces sp. SID3343]MYW04909.1 hypothetical protein [Streptomyces sp. SID3343]
MRTGREPRRTTRHPNLLLAAGLTAVLAIGGCSGDGGSDRDRSDAKAAAAPAAGPPGMADSASK